MSTTEHEPARTGWEGLFWEAFRQSRSPMVLLDDRRHVVEMNGAWVNLLGYDPSLPIGRPISELRADGPASDRVWRAALRRKQFTAVAELRSAGGSRLTVEFAGHPAVVTGRQLILMVALYTQRGRRFRPISPSRARPSQPLSPRERELVGLVGLGLTGPEIASELHLAHHTVRTHIRNAMTKTGSRSRAQLVAKTLAEAAYLVEAA